MATPCFRSHSIRQCAVNGNARATAGVDRDRGHIVDGVGIFRTAQGISGLALGWWRVAAANIDRFGDRAGPVCVGRYHARQLCGHGGRKGDLGRFKLYVRLYRRRGDAVRAERRRKPSADYCLPDIAAGHRFLGAFRIIVALENPVDHRARVKLGDAKDDGGERRRWFKRRGEYLLGRRRGASGRPRLF